jgi:catechol 2,3-dioxygenase-like lactoylglutathione lyase family enzyme
MPGVDERPPVWVGHIVMYSADVARAASFWATIGMREIFLGDEISIFELRGGTHLLVFPGEPAAEAPFDLMVDDLDATRARLADAGLDVSDVSTESNHRAFTVCDPDGATVTIRDSHVGNAPV